MIKDITFGQYFPGKSLLHRLDPRLKLVMSLLFIVFIFVANNAFSLAFIGLLTVLFIFVSRVPVSLFLKNIKAILFVIILTSVLNALYVDTGKVLAEFWVIKITVD